MIIVAVPVKDLVNAKQRLVPVLDPAERSMLARAMLRDVLRAVTSSRADQVWVVTRDPDVTAIARAFGCRPLGEAENRGHTSAARHAQEAARRAGATVFVTVPGDVPCVTGAETDLLIAAVESGRGAAFTPSRSGVGTNGAALAPPDVLPLRFGEPSFQDHLDAARGAELVPRIVPLPGLGLDVDDAADLAALLHAGPATESAQLVASWPVAARLAAGACGPSAADSDAQVGLPWGPSRPSRSSPAPRTASPTPPGASR